MLLLLRRVAGATQAIVSEISSGVTSIRSSQRSRETNIVFCRRTLTTNHERGPFCYGLPWLTPAKAYLDLFTGASS
jgi:hypothetical protein